MELRYNEPQLDRLASKKLKLFALIDCCLEASVIYVCHHTKCEFGGTVKNAPTISANFATAVGYDVAAAIGLGLSADGATAVAAEITVVAIVAVFPVVVDVVVAMDDPREIIFLFRLLLLLPLSFMGR